MQRSHLPQYEKGIWPGYMAQMMRPLAGEDGTRTQEEFDETVEKDLNSNPAKKTVWHVYNEKSSRMDESFLRGINESMDVLLIFAGLFSATSAAFLSFTLPLLERDSSQTTNHLLLSIFQKLGNASYPLPPQSDSTPSANAVVANTLIFISVAGSLLAAFFAILTKQWAVSIQEGLSTIENQSSRASIRQYRMDGVRDWYFEEMATMLPVLLHFSLALFGAGVVDFLYIIGETVLAWILLAALLAGASIYVFLSIVPLGSPKAPFWSPLTAILYSTRTVTIKLLRFVRPSRKSTQKGGLDVVQPGHLLGNKLTISRKVAADRAIEVEVIFSLMASADKDMEGPVLYACLRELQELSAKEINPKLFNRPLIFEAWSYLARTCLYNTNPPQMVPGKEARARFLCQILEWLAGLTRDPSLSENFKIIGEEGKQLCRAVFNYGCSTEDVRDMIVGHVARTSLYHMEQTKPYNCQLCVGFIGGRSEAIERQLDQELSTLWTADELRSNRKWIIAYISAQTRCLIHFAPREPPLQAAQARIRDIIKRFRLGGKDVVGEWGLRRRHIPIMRDTPFVDHIRSWVETIRKARTESYTEGKANEVAMAFTNTPAPLVGEYPGYVQERRPPVSPAHTWSPPPTPYAHSPSTVRPISPVSLDERGRPRSPKIVHGSQSRSQSPSSPLPPIPVRRSSMEKPSQVDQLPDYYIPAPGPISLPLPHELEYDGGRHATGRTRNEYGYGPQRIVPEWLSPRLEYFSRSKEPKLLSGDMLKTLAPIDGQIALINTFIISVYKNYATIVVSPSTGLTVTRISRDDPGLTTTEEPRFIVEIVGEEVLDDPIPSLTYALRALQPMVTVTPENGFATSSSQFIPHLSLMLDRLHVPFAIRQRFIQVNADAFTKYDHIAYRFMTSEELTSFADISVSLASCRFQRILLLFTGLSSTDSTAWRSVEVAEESVDWASLIFDDAEQEMDNGTRAELFEIGIMECKPRRYPSGDGNSMIDLPRKGQNSRRLTSAQLVRDAYDNRSPHGAHEHEAIVVAPSPAYRDRSLRSPRLHHDRSRYEPIEYDAGRSKKARSESPERRLRRSRSSQPIIVGNTSRSRSPRRGIAAIRRSSSTPSPIILDSDGRPSKRGFLSRLFSHRGDPRAIHTSSRRSPSPHRVLGKERLPEIPIIIQDDSRRRSRTYSPRTRRRSISPRPIVFTGSRRSRSPQDHGYSRRSRSRSPRSPIYRERSPRPRYERSPDEPMEYDAGGRRRRARSDSLGRRLRRHSTSPRDRSPHGWPRRRSASPRERSPREYAPRRSHSSTRSRSRWIGQLEDDDRGRIRHGSRERSPTNRLSRRDSPSRRGSPFRRGSPRRNPEEYDIGPIHRHRSPRSRYGPDEYDRGTHHSRSPTRPAGRSHRSKFEPVEIDTGRSSSRRLTRLTVSPLRSRHSRRSPSSSGRASSEEGVRAPRTHASRRQSPPITVHVPVEYEEGYTPTRRGPRRGPLSQIREVEGVRATAPSVIQVQVPGTRGRRTLNTTLRVASPPAPASTAPSIIRLPDGEILRRGETPRMIRVGLPTPGPMVIRVPSAPPLISRGAILRIGRSRTPDPAHNHGTSAERRPGSPTLITIPGHQPEPRNSQTIRVGGTPTPIMASPPASVEHSHHLTSPSVIQLPAPHYEPQRDQTIRVGGSTATPVIEEHPPSPAIIQLPGREYDLGRPQMVRVGAPSGRQGLIERPPPAPSIIQLPGQPSEPPYRGQTIRVGAPAAAPVFEQTRPPSPAIIQLPGREYIPGRHQTIRVGTPGGVHERPPTAPSIIQLPGQAREQPHRGQTIPPGLSRIPEIVRVGDYTPVPGASRTSLDRPSSHHYPEHRVSPIASANGDIIAPVASRSSMDGGRSIADDLDRMAREADEEAETRRRRRGAAYLPESANVDFEDQELRRQRQFEEFLEAQRQENERLRKTLLQAAPQLRREVGELSPDLLHGVNKPQNIGYTPEAVFGDPGPFSRYHKLDNIRRRRSPIKLGEPNAFTQGYRHNSQAVDPTPIVMQPPFDPYYGQERRRIRRSPIRVAQPYLPYDEGPYRTAYRRPTMPIGEPPYGQPWPSRPARRPPTPPPLMSQQTPVRASSPGQMSMDE